MALFDLSANDMLALMENRKSVRRYDKSLVPQNVDEKIFKAFEQSEKLLDNSLRLEILDAETISQYAGPTYNTFVSAPKHVVAISSTEHGFLENTGFVKESVILKLTELGYSTCWVGAFINEERLGKIVNLQPNERILTLAPFGTASTKSTAKFVNKMVSSSGNTKTGKKRLSMDEIVFHGKFGRSAQNYLAEHKALLDVFKAVRFAPSWMNTQPWRYIITNDQIYVFGMTTFKGKKLSGNRGGLDYLHLDVGISMKHFSLLSKIHNIEGQWELFNVDDIPVELNIPDTAIPIAKFLLK